MKYLQKYIPVKIFQPLTCIYENRYYIYKFSAVVNRSHKVLWFCSAYTGLIWFAKCMAVSIKCLYIETFIASKMVFFFGVKLSAMVC